MKSILILACSLFIVFPGSLFAELCKYYDKNNTLCFTNDFSMVPADQRLAIETIHEIKTTPVISKESVINKDTQSYLGENIVKEVALKLELEQESKKLEALKKEMDYEYIALKKRQAILFLERKRKLNSIETKEYNQRVKGMNLDTLKYKEKKQAYLKKLEEYNLKLESFY